jgi:RNA polymerase sigma factor (sigma-70 family)
VAHDFPDTQWSQIVALRDDDHPQRREMLACLAEKYWSPVYHYVRSLRRVSPEDAQDHTQQFFAHLLEPGRIGTVGRSFRGFLKTALRNFLTDADRAARARPLNLPYNEAEASWQQSPDLSPEESFDRAWRRTVLTEAVGRLRDELGADGRTVQLAIFDTYCLADSDLTYREVAAEHGVSEDDVGNRLRESRERLRQITRRLLREYLGGDEEVEAELGLIRGK